MYVIRLCSMEHSSANILTHCVDGGWGRDWGGGAGLFKKKILIFKIKKFISKKRKNCKLS